MTVKLPEKAGFVATTKEWDDLVRIAENLAAQVVQRDAALREMQAERDAAKGLIEYWKDRTMLYLKEADQRAAAARKVAQWARQAQDDTHKWATLANAKANELDVARAEVARLRLALEDAYTVGDVVQMRLYIAATLRQPGPAPAKGQD